MAGLDVLPRDIAEQAMSAAEPQVAFKILVHGETVADIAILNHLRDNPQMDADRRRWTQNSYD